MTKATGFTRLTAHYPERMAMVRANKDAQADITFNHIPYFRRFGMFIIRIRLRLFILASLAALFNYWGNLLGVGSSKLERSFKKYKKRWIFRYNP